MISSRAAGAGREKAGRTARPFGNEIARARQEDLARAVRVDEKDLVDRSSYFSRLSTSWGCWLAWASIAVEACLMICVRVSSDVVSAKFVS